ncbi:MAG: choice-of-anchor D domain-containing protein, partial [Planctomycetota bacterium]
MKTTHLFHLVAWSFAFVCLPCVYGEPDINVVPLSHDFGQVEVGSSETVVITIHNEGGDPITIESATFQSGSSSDYSITSLFFPPVFFGAGGHFDLDVTFAPSVGGPSQDILEIESTDPDQPLVQVVLTGEGTGGETTPPEQIEEINDFVKTSVDDRTLVGTGSGSSARNRLRTFVKKLQIVESLIEQELF